MSLTLKQILDQVHLLAAVDTYDAYVNQGTAEVERVVALANQSAITLSQYPWQGLRKRYEFTLTSATEYDLPSDYRAFIPDTMFTDNHVWGADFPTDTSFWSYLQATSIGSDARYHMRLLGNKLQVFSPDSGQTVSFEYLSSHPVLDTDGTTTKARFDADTDTFRLDDDLLIKDVLWRYKKLTGQQDWQVDAQDFKSYEIQKKGQDKGAQTLVPGEGMGEIGEPYYNLWRPVPNA